MHSIRATKEEARFCVQNCAMLRMLDLGLNYNLVYIPYSSMFMVHIPSYKLNIFVAKLSCISIGKERVLASVEINQF